MRVPPLRRFVILLCSALAAPVALADKTPLDGRYSARVRTDSGTYRVPVDVVDGEVRVIHWPNGGRMRVRGAELDDDAAIGRTSRGDAVRIEVDDLDYDTSGGYDGGDSEGYEEE